LSARDWSDDRLHVALDLLLLIQVLWGDWWGSKLLHLVATQVHALELLSGCLNVDELLLQSLLLLCEVHVGSYQLSIQVWVHLFLAVLINKDLRRSKNLLWNGVHLSISVHLTVSVLA
jgi:hypothetical protein